MVEDFVNLFVEGIEKCILYVGKSDVLLYEDGIKVIIKYFIYLLYFEFLRCRGGRNECLWSIDYL